MSRNVNRDLAPGETQKIEGLVMLRDWKGDMEANAYCEIVQRDDGTAHVELRRYAAASRGFTDRRRVALEPALFAALADALFDPVEGDAVITRLRAEAVASGRYVSCPRCDGRAWRTCRLCHGKGIAPVARATAFVDVRRGPARQRRTVEVATE